MTLQERKDEADIISKEADVIAKHGDLVYKKLIILTAIAGGSWLFGIKANGIENYFSLVAFGLSSVGVVVNLFRLGEAINKIKELK